MTRSITQPACNYSPDEQVAQVGSSACLEVETECRLWDIFMDEEETTTFLAKVETERRQKPQDIYTDEQIVALQLAPTASSRERVMAQGLGGLVSTKQSSRTHPNHQQTFDDLVERIRELNETGPYSYSLPRQIELRDKRTGEILSFNSIEAGLARMVRRITSWGRTLRLIYGDRLESDFEMKHITLTYAGRANWRQKHITEFFKQLRRCIGESLVSYAWVSEMQWRGEPHYHIALLVPKGTRIPYPDKAGLWPHGMSRVQTAKAGAGYLISYAQKIEQKMTAFPKGMRKFATVLPRCASKYARWSHQLSRYPKWLRDVMRETGNTYDCPIPKKLDGGWLIRETGEILRSPYEFLSVGEPGVIAPMSRRLEVPMEHSPP